MQLTARIVFSLVAVATAGALSGAAIGTTPMITHASTDSGRPHIVFGEGSEGFADHGGAQADHYAIHTPEGRFEIGELAERGLYSQARYAGRTLSEPIFDEAARELAYAEPSTRSDDFEEPVTYFTAETNSDQGAPRDPLFAPGPGEAAAGEPAAGTAAL